MVDTIVRLKQMYLKQQYLKRHNVNAFITRFNTKALQTQSTGTDRSLDGP